MDTKRLFDTLEFMQSENEKLIEMQDKLESSADNFYSQLINLIKECNTFLDLYSESLHKDELRQVYNLRESWSQIITQIDLPKHVIEALAKKNLIIIIGDTYSILWPKNSKLSKNHSSLQSANLSQSPIKIAKNKNYSDDDIAVEVPKR